MPASKLAAYVCGAAVLLRLGGAFAAEPCPGFKWNVAKEEALFAVEATPLIAGRLAASAPAMGTDRLYELALVPQAGVTFAVEPGKKKPVADAYGGLTTLHLPTPGIYRVAVDGPLWIDVVADGKLAVTRDFQGRHGCGAPHKIVEFDLSGSKRFVLQLSGATDKIARLTVTKSPG